MSYEITKVEVWAGDILNRPGMLARVLEALSNAGAEMEFLIARRASETTSRVFVAPIKGVKQKKAAADMGLVRAAGLFAQRNEVTDRPGLGSGDCSRTTPDSERKTAQEQRHTSNSATPPSVGISPAAPRSFGSANGLDSESAQRYAPFV